MEPNPQPYHHGNLRPAVLRAAIETIEEVGPSAMSVREVARRAGVTHTAVTYHFVDKAGLLTAIAIEGFQRLAEALRQTQETTDSFLEVGVAYLRFALNNRAHFEVMYRPEIYRSDDTDLQRAKASAALMLYGTERAESKELAAGVAAWSIVHGFATLWLGGNIPPRLGDNPEEIARLILVHLQSPVR
jgi:AcrR family transcriptional regulator